MSNIFTVNIDNDGFVERTGWVGANDGILVQDLSGDGIINNVTETFSEYYNNGNYSDGIAALATLDSNHDGVINNQDTGDL